MKITNKKMMNQFRQAPFCELCSARSRGRLEPHHVTSRGHGGGWRMDIPENLVALCHECHSLRGDDPDWLDRFLQIIARREGFLNGSEVLDFLHRVRNAPKGSEIPQRLRA